VLTLNVSFGPAPVQTTPTSASVAFGFGYDATNRRISQTATDNTWWYYPPAASTTSYTANDLNQYSAVGSVTPTYDANGDLTSDGTFTYGYDAENRLISASGTGLSAAYAYDAQGRRKSKTVNGTTTIYVTDADNREVLEYDGTSGAIGNWYPYALGPNDVLNQVGVATGTRATFIPDIHGSFIGSLDANSGTLTKTSYLPYGGSTSTSGSFGYTGQRIDPETSGLYYYRTRMYAPAWGRFMQPDPIGYAAAQNLYRYVANDPLNLVDTWGLTPDQPTPVIGSATAAQAPPFAIAAAAGGAGGGGGAQGPPDDGEPPDKGYVIRFQTAHAAPHYEGTGLSQAEVEAEIERLLRVELETPPTPSLVGRFIGRIEFRGTTIEYRGYPLPNNVINIGTHFPVDP